MLTPTQRKEKLHSVIRVASGNFLEMYNFMVFGYFSSAIGRAYFPASSEFASLMFSMTTFAVGFMMRPLGAIFLGAYIIHETGNRAVPGAWLSVAAAIAFVSAWISRPRKADAKRETPLSPTVRSSPN